MSQWWVFHEDKVEEAIRAWIAERRPGLRQDDDDDIDDADAVREFLASEAVKRLGMRKE